MNNLDILEELKEWFNNFDLDSIKHKPEEYIQAISTLIAENKELKETVEKRDNKIYELLDRSINALKLTNKEEVKQDYIPKSKVEMEIHDIDNWLEGGRYIHYGLNPHELEAQKKVLQSLLGKE